MGYPLTLPVGSILYFDTGTDAVTPTWTKLSEHNRSPINIDVDRIEKTDSYFEWKRRHDRKSKFIRIMEKSNYNLCKGNYILLIDIQYQTYLFQQIQSFLFR